MVVVIFPDIKPFPEFSENIVLVSVLEFLVTCVGVEM